jgi:Protein of unknown function (DUF2568)
MTMLRGFALLVRFVLELAALAALAVTGVRVVGGVAGVLVAIALVAAAATTWGLFVAPRARYPLVTPARLAIEVGVFVAAGLGLALSGEYVFAAVLLAVYLLDRLALWTAGAPTFAPPPRGG